MAAQMVGSAALSRLAELFRTLAVQAMGTATLGKAVSVFRTIGAECAMAASLARGFYQTLAAVMATVAASVQTFTAGVPVVVGDFLHIMLKSGKDLMQRFVSKTDLGKRTEGGKDPTGRETGKKGHRR